jgi:hypothetical protein
MSRTLGFMLGAIVILSLGQGVKGQGVVNYPPAEGHMVIVPPLNPAPGAVGSPYVETFPRYGNTYQANPSYPVQQVVPYATQTRPAPAARGRVRLPRGTRVYSRGYAQAPAPYATQLPRGDLQWPGSYLTPGYSPYSRFQTYGQGYGVSPYGSNYWGGYYKGFPMIGN